MLKFRLFRRIVASVKRMIRNVKADFAHLDRNNEDISKVYAANYVSGYRGALVLRHSGRLLTSWAWGHTIMLNRSANALPAAAQKQLVQHEYGHILQRRELGSFRYAFRIFLPSATHNLRARFDPELRRRYYELPWEHDADVRGGVERKQLP